MKQPLIFEKSLRELTQIAVGVRQSARRLHRLRLPPEPVVGILENFERLGPRAAWTGPLARGDYGVIAAHLAAMKGLPREFSNAYAALNGLASAILSPVSATQLTTPESRARNKISIVKPLVKARTAGGKG